MLTGGTLAVKYRGVTMRKTLVPLALAAFVLFSPSLAALDGGLKKYLRPANITTLDWLLLKAEVSSFSGNIRWDAGVSAGLTRRDARFGLTGGLTYRFKKR